MTLHALVWRTAAAVSLTAAALLALGDGAGATFTDRARTAVGIHVGTVGVVVARAEVTSSSSSQGSCESCDPLTASAAITRDAGAVALALSGQPQSLDVTFTVTLLNRGTLPARTTVEVTGPDTDSAVAQSLTASRADGSSSTVAALERGQTWISTGTLAPGDDLTFTVQVSGRELSQRAAWSVAPLFTLSTTEVPTRNHLPSNG